MSKLFGRDSWMRTFYRCLLPLSNISLLKPDWLKTPFELVTLAREYGSFSQQQTNNHFVQSLRFLYPCLNDNTPHTPVEPVYFFQDTWAAGKIFTLNPEHHYDVGSSLMTMGIISQFTPVTMIDLRPPTVELPQLHFQYGSILELPFAGNSIASLSSLCVIEHIGLGRYGDPLDSWGSEKAARELSRVLQPDGNLFVSVPVDAECRVYFNAHRTFTRKYVLEIFAELELVEEKYVYGLTVQDNYNPAQGFGTGLFHLRKPLDDRDSNKTYH